MRTLAADAILLVHFLFVAFVVLGLAAAWLGAALRWRWVRDPRFRLTHLAAIVLVTAESLAGIWCPLTLWEDALRGGRQDMSFVARLVHGVLYYDLPEWVFTAAYVGFAAAVALTFWLLPPRGMRRTR